MLRPSFSTDTRPRPQSEQYVRDALAKMLPPNEKLPATKAFEVYSVLALDTNLNTGQLFIPDIVFVVYLLDVGYSSIPLLYSIGTSPDNIHIFSARDRKESSLIFPHQVGRLLVGQKPGVEEAVIRAALTPYVRQVLSYNPNLIEVEVSPFRELEAATLIESNLSALVRYAEPSPYVRFIYSPGWFAKRLL